MLIRIVFLSLGLILGNSSLRADSPTARIDYALCYLPSASGMILQGGWGPPSWNPLNETWKLDASGWTNITASNAPALSHHAMTYDSARGNLVVCGTTNGSTAHTVWNFNGTNWVTVTNLAAANGDVELTYDSARQRTVLYRASETWESDGTSWLKMNSAQQASVCTDGALFKYDETRHYSVLVLTTNAAVQTWLWNGTNWAQATGTQPSKSDAGGMVYDRARGQVILLSTDMKTWGFDGTNWTQLAPAHPPAYYSMAFFGMEYDPSRQAALFFSGEGKVTTNAAYTHPTTIWQWQGQAQSGAGDWQVLVPGFTGYSLGIQLTGGKVLLSWSTNATGYLLESVASLPGVSWQTVTNSTVVSGTQFLTTNNLAPGQAFYRLHLP